MTNQAAQTMPVIDDFNGDNAKLIESARALISLSDSGSLAPHGIGGHARAILSAFIVRTEAAALAQTAWVADGPLSGKYGDVLRPFVIQMERELHANAGKGDRPGWLKMRPEVALLEIYYHLAKLQKAVKDDNGPGIQEYAADVANMSMILLDICGGLALIEYAAPAASGGECPAGVECARTNPELHRCKREAEAQFPGASVSERARELRERAEAHGGGVFVSVGDIRVIEQALAQQRGAEWSDDLRAVLDAASEASAVPLTWFANREFSPEQTKAWLCDTVDNTVADGAFSGELHGIAEEESGLTVAFTGCGPKSAANAKFLIWCAHFILKHRDALATTPQPSADAVRELVRKWREDAEIADRNTEGNSYASCADELESLLSAASGEKGVG